MPELEKRIGCTFTSLIDATSQQLQVQGMSAVGLLASPTTVRTKLYERKMEEMNISMLLPTPREMRLTEDCIRGVIAGHNPKRAKKLLQPIIDRFYAHGAETVILGCTELSVIFRNSTRENITDPLAIITKGLLS